MKKIMFCWIYSTYLMDVNDPDILAGSVDSNFTDESEYKISTVWQQWTLAASILNCKTNFKHF